MSGRKYLLDTNIILKFLQGHPSLEFLSKPGTQILISVISILELRCNTTLSARDMQLVLDFIEIQDCIDITREDEELVKAVTQIRKKYKLKLPDAIIAASAITTSSFLVSGDIAFKNIFGLQFNLIPR
jgi:predicted nucleic acid-binding protein